MINGVSFASFIKFEMKIMENITITIGFMHEMFYSSEEIDEFIFLLINKEEICLLAENVKDVHFPVSQGFKL